MTRDQVIALYNKERNYEEMVFGEYSKIRSLSFPSFLAFLRVYIEKAEEAYAGKWEKELPPWLKTCAEYEAEAGGLFAKAGTAPVKAYEEVIKIMALAGAALESYATIDASKWREDPDVDAEKWKD